MDFGIRGKAALVTGASSGIGAAVALCLAGEGVRLGLASRDKKRCESVAAKAKAAGAPDARAFALDLEDAGTIAPMLAAYRAAFGDPDIAVLNGGGPKPARVTELALDDWDGAYRLLLRGMLSLLGQLVGPMRAKRWGRIVALTSTSVKQPIDTLALSNVFRTGLVSAVRSLAVEVASDGVTANAIATGRIDTERLRELYGNDKARLSNAATEVPIGRLASPQEFAPMAVFLCSDPAGYVTGQTISVDGGLVRGLYG